MSSSREIWTQVVDEKAEASVETSSEPLMKDYVYKKSIFLCKFCGATCSSRWLLTVHLQEHTGKKAFQCRLCELSFDLSKELQHHRESRHSGAKTFRCDICDLSFFSQLSLFHHCRVHRPQHPLECAECPKTPPDMGPPYRCLNCGRRCCCQANLRKHGKRHRRGDRFPCDDGFCEASFSSTIALDHHREQRHRDENAHKCGECGLGFRHASNFKVHKKIHSRGHPVYKCKHCEWSFSHPANLKQHELIHSGDRPYKCHHCFSSFDQKLHLTHHQVIHAG